MPFQAHFGDDEDDEMVGYYWRKRAQEDKAAKDKREKMLGKV